MGFPQYKSLGVPGIRVAEYCVDAIWTLNTAAANSIYIPPMNWKEVVESTYSSCS